ncbi:MAG: lamin tail domain-containing protein [Candidatus Marinimicrobia bacterium]|nr:lamin tail domain-containing protein [Candidatus Neomarinimicrobiota bacterium]
MKKMIILLSLITVTSLVLGQDLYINEFMASNDYCCPDEYGDYDDWIEIYNGGTDSVDIGGMYITDDLTDPDSWQIPDTASALTTIPPGGFLILWADKESEQGPLHVEEKLSGGGEQIGLYASDGSTVIDTLTFGAQAADTSYARTADGGSTWTSDGSPTPGISNTATTVYGTFTVDLSGETVSANGVHAAGNFQDYDYDGNLENPIYPNWNPGGIELDSVDVGIFSVKLLLVPGTFEFKFINGNTWGGDSDDEWAGDDAQGFFCQVDGGNNRILTVGESDFSYGPVCWESCVDCDEVAITFQVDMSNETVATEGVHVAGSMQGWNPATSELVLNDSTGYYEITMGSVIGDTIQYKYVNGNAWGNDESAPDECSFPGSWGNRWLVIPDVDYTTPAVCYGACLACDAVYVTFQVDMENEEISTDGIHIAGSFQGWDPAATEMTDADGDSIFEITVGLASGDQVAYKFVNGNTWDGAEGVPSDCATDGNRTFTPGDVDITVDAVCFATCASCVPANYQTATITFQADISEMVTFDPVAHTLEIRGGMNGWSGGDAMQQDLVDPYLYKLDIEFEENVGNEVQWKFKANPDSAWNNSGWEVGDNHTFIWTGDDVALDVMQPNILPTGAPLENDVTLYFEVEWIDGTLNYNSGVAFPQKPDTIVFNGSFINGWYTWGDCMDADCANPASSEMPHLADGDGDNIFTGSLLLPEGHSNLFTAKFGAWYDGIEDDTPGSNGAVDNEAGFGQDRNVIVPLGVTEYTYVTRFGENNPDNPWLEIINDSNIIPEKFALRDNYPNPFNPTTKISFDLPIVADVKINIYNVLGRQIATLHHGHLEAGSYNFIWHGRDQNGSPVASGIYFYELQAGSQFHKIKKMTLMK